MRTPLPRVSVLFNHERSIVAATSQESCWSSLIDQADRRPEHDNVTVSHTVGTMYLSHGIEGPGCDSRNFAPLRWVVESHDARRFREENISRGCLQCWPWKNDSKHRICGSNEARDKLYQLPCTRLRSGMCLCLWAGEACKISVDEGFYLINHSTYEFHNIWFCIHCNKCIALPPICSTLNYTIMI